MKVRTPARARVLAVALALQLGCAAPVGVHFADERAVDRALTASVLSSGRPSAPSLQLLSRNGLAERFDRDPVGVLAQLHAELATHPAPAARRYALAELCYFHADRSGDRRYFLAAAVYAWAFLLPEDRSEAPGPFDPRLRTAADLYNRGLANGLAPDRQERLLDLRPRSIALPFGELELAGDPALFEWQGFHLAQFVSIADLEVQGLRNRYRSRGLGAPVAATLEPGSGGAAPASARWIPPRIRVPLTLVVELDASRVALASGRVQGRLQLRRQGEGPLAIDGRAVPVEAESTSAFAYMLAGSRLWDAEIAGFRTGDLRFFRDFDENLMMLEPHERGRIPVVFVHGTASSPARWADLVNEIAHDPSIQPHYEFWLFFYNTGNPILWSARILRDTLGEIVSTLDPEASDAALRRMVVIGHSQGGLLTKLTSVESGSRFWDQLSERPLESLEMQAEKRELLRRTLFVSPLPYVRRVVFIATPHRGSYVAANRLVGWLAQHLIRLPVDVLELASELGRATIEGGASAETMASLRRIPLSVDDMRPSNPVLRTLASLPIAAGVAAHSIVPVLGDGPPEHGADGVVRYESAHIEGVASELVVRSGHSTQSEPATINEVRRILREHLLP